MPRLTSREKMLPRNLTFYIAPLRWTSPPGSSFDDIVRGAIAVLSSQPHVAQQLGWDLSYPAMADRIDEHLATICEKLEMRQYYTGRPGGAPVAAPFTMPDIRRPDLYQRGFGGSVAANKFPPPQQSPRMQGSIAVGVSMIKKLAAGAASLLEWNEAGLPHVSQEVADKRASICAVCPKNNQGKNLTDYFTVPLAEMIKKRVEVMLEMDLKTPYDDKLKVCEGCLCPLRTKVFFPDELILKRISDQTRSELNQQNPRCWILDLK